MEHRTHTVLITGGAGFIGSHVADELLKHGYHVRAFDNLCPQVHGSAGQWPAYLHPEVETIRGDVCDRAALRQALHGVDSVIHLAAAVGVGQSMYQIEHYVSTNCRGTALLLEEIAERPLQRLVVASSMSIYGEGLYRGSNGELVQDADRDPHLLRVGVWELQGRDSHPLTPLPTPESKRPSLSSVYALTKFDQERLCLMLGQARATPTVALRFFNVYGPRQALSNPYTGVLAIFASRLLNDRPPLIYEDGYQQRDFVSVYDVARATRLALECKHAVGKPLNIGSGQARTVREVAEKLALLLGKSDISPQITGRYRVGDIRHCFADISAAQQVLGYQPQVDFEDGLRELSQWLREQSAEDRADAANAELAMRGLTV